MLRTQDPSTFRHFTGNVTSTFCHFTGNVTRDGLRPSPSIRTTAVSILTTSNPVGGVQGGSDSDEEELKAMLHFDHSLLLGGGGGVRGASSQGNAPFWAQSSPKSCDGFGSGYAPISWAEAAQARADQRGGGVAHEIYFDHQLQRAGLNSVDMLSTSPPPGEFSEEKRIYSHFVDT
jgi:hypothetical protein